MSEPAPAAVPGAGPSGPPLGGRLHPAVLAIWPLGQVVPLAFVVVAGGWNAVASGAVAALALIAGVVRWWRFTWRVEGRSVVIEQGLLARQRRVLPFDRIQSVDLVAPLRHRLFGVVQVRLEAVGGSETEGALDAVSVADAERLRATVLSARAAPGAPLPPMDGAAAVAPLVRMSARRLVQAGLTGGRVGVAAALLGGGQQLYGDRLGDLAERLPGLAPTGVALIAVAAVVGGFLLSVAATVVAYWGFTLSRVGDELRIRRGLLERRQATIPLRRVQSLRVEENLVRRVLGMAAVKADVAGAAGGDQARDSGVLLPLGSRYEARQLVATLLEDPGLAHVVLTPSPTRARRRRLLRAALVTLVLTVPAVVVAGPQGAAVVPLVGAPAVALALAAHRALGRGETAAHVVTRSGVLVRRTAAVGVPRIQGLRLRTSPSQRRFSLGTLELEIARSPGVWAGPRLVDLDRGDAEALLRRLAGRLTAPRARTPEADPV